MNTIWFSEHKNREVLNNILSGFIKKNIYQFLDEKKKTYFIEDNTWNILFMKELFELIPDAKFIHVTRDPRDVVASMIKQRWCPSELDQTINLYLSIIEKSVGNTNSISTDNIITIKLEDIVRDYHNTIK
ncbi:MAG: sulfotransferase [Bacteroidetes bacterium]|nr:sulfotransferase [Bacteroidota bacterium]